MTSKPQTPPFFLALAIIIFIFVVDILTPLGIAEWLFYLIPIVYLHRFSSNKNVITLAVICTVFIIAGYFLSSPGISLYYAAINRMMGTTILWLEVFILVRLNRKEVERRQEFEKRQHAEEQETETNKRLTNILENMSDAFVALDTNWCYTYMNKRAGEIFGRNPHEMLGKHIWTEFPEGVGQPFYHNYYKAVETQQPITIEEYYPPYDMWFENHIYPSRDGLSIFFQDVTEKKKREIALKESQQKLQLALDASNTGLWDWNIKTNEVYFSPEWKRQLGYTDAEVPNEFATWEKNLHPDDKQAAMEKTMEFVHHHSGDFENEFRLQHKDGSYRWIHTNAKLFLDSEGKPERMLGSHLDITIRKHAEESLKESEEKFLTIFKAAPGSMILASYPEGKTIEVNDNFSLITGYSREEALGKTTGGLNMWANPSAREQYLSMLLTNGFVKDFEADLNHKSGTIRNGLVSGQILSVQGKKYLIGTFNDITERKQAEEKLRLSEELFSNAFHTSPAGMTITRIADGKIIDANQSFFQIFEFNREEVIGHTSTELNILTLDERKKLIQLQIETGGLHNAELLSHSKSGKPVNLLFSSKPMEISGEQCHITTLIDITDRKKADEEIQKLATIVQRSPEFIGIAGLDAKAIYLNDGGKKLVELDRDIAATTMFDFFAPIDLKLFQQEVIPTIQKENRWRGEIYLRNFKNGERIPVLMDIFFIFNPNTDEPIAFATVTTDIRESKKAEELLQQQKNTLQQLTEQLLSTQESERKRISHELHDELGQSLTMLKLNIESLKKELSESATSSAIQKLETMTSLSETVLDQIHELTLELHPSMLDDLGLLQTLRWHLDRFGKQTNITPKILTQNFEQRLQPNIEIALYRIVQEATTNIAKHANAKNVIVTISKSEALLNVTIEDDGRGFSLNEIEQRATEHFGIGIIGMKERVSLLNGTMRIETAMGEGTKIIIALPI
ncbi:MAG: PAS domain S-box protein [Ignavibacteriales bacterium]|nr:PAS domain S-box protein [Ignavibacteriales bacterium]